MNITPDFAESRPNDPGMRGHAVLYRVKGENSCPDCGGRQWMVGRVVAECAFCGTALPMETALSGFTRFAGDMTPLRPV